MYYSIEWFNYITLKNISNVLLLVNAVLRLVHYIRFDCQFMYKWGCFKCMFSYKVSQLNLKEKTNHFIQALFCWLRTSCICECRNVSSVNTLYLCPRSFLNIYILCHITFCVLFYKVKLQLRTALSWGSQRLH